MLTMRNATGKRIEAGTAIFVSGPIGEPGTELVAHHFDGNGVIAYVEPVQRIEPPHELAAEVDTEME